MEKTYETYAKKILIFKQTHKQEARKVLDTANQILVNKRFSDYGKREALEALKTDIGNLNKEFSESIRGVIRQFCKEYSVSFAEDNADHSADVANALKVIDMCGARLTGELLRSVLDPLKGSHKAMKIIYDVLSIKLNHPVVGSEYAPEIQNILFEYTGTTTEINEYLDRLKEIEAVADYPVLSNYEIINQGYNGEYRFEMQDRASYSVCALPDWIAEAGKQYEALAMKYPLMFTNYIPSHEEIILDGLNG